ncbi:MAG: hypothetical protein R3E90_07810 [Marinicella sp.]
MLDLIKPITADYWSKFIFLFNTHFYLTNTLENIRTPMEAFKAGHIDDLKEAIAMTEAKINNGVYW